MIQPMVSMKDYEGFAGFSPLQGSEAASLQKALSAGYQNPRTDGGNALRVESLEATLRTVTFSEKHIKFWKDLPKIPAYSTVHDFNLLDDYGGDGGTFVNEGEAPQVSDSAYERKIALLKFMATQREVTHQATLVKPAHGNMIALETRNGAIHLLRNVEQSMFFGRSDCNPASFDGIDQQLRQDSTFSTTNILDLRGSVITRDKIEEASNILTEQGFGEGTDLYLAPRALSDFGKTLYPTDRRDITAVSEGRVSSIVRVVETQNGDLALKSDVFLRSGRIGGRKQPPVVATAVRAPGAPTFSAGNATSISSQFAAADVGTYTYRVTAFNRFGESAPAAAATHAVAAAGDGTLLTITDAGSGEPSTGYRVYRDTLASTGSANVKFLYEVPRVGAAATTLSTDTNRYLPGTSKAYMEQVNMNGVWVSQLAPMFKVPLATIALSIRWIQAMYMTPIQIPKRLVIFDNVFDD